MQIKYPRTMHLPWSNPSSDDKVIKSLEFFEGQDIVVTEKMDGENTTMYCDFIHARSLEYARGDDRGFVKSLQAQIGYKIPDGWRICGENLYAKHSIHYNNLPSFFLVFSVWDENNVCLSWDKTVDFAKSLDLQMVPVLYRGEWNEKVVRSLYKEGTEGYVVRRSDSFHYDEFKNCVAKYVRANHVTTDKHWRHTQIVPNQLREQNLPVF